MLQRLKISNVALIKDLEIEFDNGLNVLSGETGAGKSIIIDSINFLLGDRADKTLIRNGESFARVEGLFLTDNNENIKTILNNFGIEYQDYILISRLMSKENKSEIRINGSIITLSMLKEISHLLVDICGQNENQFLLKSKNQLDMLDSFCCLQELVNKYKNELFNYHNILDRLKSFGGTEEQRKKEIDFLEFEINEILEAKLKDGEEIEIQDELKKMQNIEKISKAVNIASEYFENQQGILSSLKLSMKEISSVSQYDPKLKELSQRIETAKFDLDDISYELKAFCEDLEFDQDKFLLLDSRMDYIKRLQKKYGRTTKDILEYAEKLQSDLDKLNNSAEEIEKLEVQKQKSLDLLFSIGNKITKIRKTNAIKLENLIINELKNLNMLKTQFKISFNEDVQRENIEKNLFSSGLNQIEFLFSANIGQPLLPLSKIISGGEMSRFMLAIKSVLAECDNIETLIFDEIDTGISGKTMVEVAKKMAKLSKNHQILVVTHSFQVVAMADKNLYVSKKQKDNETLTSIKSLNESEIIESLSQLLGTEEIKETATMQAIELRNWSKKVKMDF